MKANVIFSNFFTPEKVEAARKLIEQLNIEICDDEEGDEKLPKMKIITKSINEIPFNGNLECLTLTPLCLQQIITMNTISQDSDSNHIKNPFDLQTYGNFFYNLFLLNKKIAFGNISEEEKERLSKKIVYMGGEIVDLENNSINYILTENKCENKYNVPLVLPSWIDSLFESSSEISTNRFKVDEGDFISANGSPNTNSSRHILLTLPDKPLLSQPKNFAFKNKNANSQPVSSSKGKTKKIGKGIPAKPDSRQMILNFAKSTRTEVRSQSLNLTSNSVASLSQSRKQVSTKQKVLRKPNPSKSNDNVYKIDNFMKPVKDITPLLSSQLIVTIDGKAIDDKEGDISENDYGSNDEGINEEAKTYEKKVEQKVLQSINNNFLRTHGKLVKSSNNSDEEDQIVPFNDTRNKSRSNSKSNPSVSKNTSLKKLSMIPSILNEMTEDPLLSSDNESDLIGSNLNKSKSNKQSVNSSQSFQQMDDRHKELTEFSDFDSKSPKKVKLQTNDVNGQLKENDDYSNHKCESELIRDLTSFSQSSCELGESQNLCLSGVYYDSRPAKFTENENESQKTEMVGNDPLIDCWEMFQEGNVNMK